MKYSRVLSIAGSDSCGGAGIQADIKTISACGGYAATAITAVTVQNTLGVEGVHPIPLEIIEGQIEAVLSDVGADALKIGMLHSAEVVEVVCRMVDRYRPRHVVVDPVMVSTSGHRLIEGSAIDMLRGELLPRATLITPNIPEAEILLGRKIDSLKEASQQLAQWGDYSVLLKAGHLEADTLTDILYSGGEIYELGSPRIDTRNTHGTGCTLSSALATYLARGFSMVDATRLAKEYLLSALRAGAAYEVGAGHGGVDHLFSIR